MLTEIVSNAAGSGANFQQPKRLRTTGEIQQMLYLPTLQTAGLKVLRNMWLAGDTLSFCMLNAALQEIPIALTDRGPVESVHQLLQAGLDAALMDLRMAHDVHNSGCEQTGVTWRYTHATCPCLHDVAHRGQVRNDRGATATCRLDQHQTKPLTVAGHSLNKRRRKDCGPCDRVQEYQFGTLRRET